jgi:hypothetical protein
LWYHDYSASQLSSSRPSGSFRERERETTVIKIIQKERERKITVIRIIQREGELTSSGLLRERQRAHGPQAHSTFSYPQIPGEKLQINPIELDFPGYVRFEIFIIIFP